MPTLIKQPIEEMLRKLRLRALWKDDLLHLFGNRVNNLWQSCLERVIENRSDGRFCQIFVEFNSMWERKFFGYVRWLRNYDIIKARMNKPKTE